MSRLPTAAVGKAGGGFWQKVASPCKNHITATFFEKKIFYFARTAGFGTGIASSLLNGFAPVWKAPKTTMAALSKAG